MGKNVADVTAATVAVIWRFSLMPCTSTFLALLDFKCLVRCGKKIDSSLISVDGEFLGNVMHANFANDNYFFKLRLLFLLKVRREKFCSTYCCFHSI